MKKAIRFLVCFLLSSVAVYICGFGNLVSDISESLAVFSFIGVSLLFSVIVFTIVGMHFKIKELSERIENLENEAHKS